MPSLFRLMLALGLLAAVTGCPSLSDSLNPTAGKTTYPSIWINATWSGGRTGTPLESKSVVPTTVQGSYCPTNSLDLENHNDKYWSTLGDVGLTVLNTCSIAIVEAAICRSAGSGSASSLPVCSTDPRQTPYSNLLIQRLSPGGRNPYGATSLNLDINVFYCASGSSMNLGQVSGKAPTDCVVQ